MSMLVYNKEDLSSFYTLNINTMIILTVMDLPFLSLPGASGGNCWEIMPKISGKDSG